MFEAIEKILDLKKFKKEIFKGKIFVFQKSQFTLDLIQEIKTEISSEYDGELEKIHYLDECETISTNLVSNLKNSKIFKELFKSFLIERGFYNNNSYWDQFRIELHLLKIDLITERHQELAHIEIHGEQIFINKLIGGDLLVLLTKQIQ